MTNSDGVSAQRQGAVKSNRVVLLTTDNGYPHVPSPVSEPLARVVERRDDIRWHILAAVDASAGRRPAFRVPTQVERVTTFRPDSLARGLRTDAGATNPMRGLVALLGQFLRPEPPTAEILAGLAWCRDNAEAVSVSLREGRSDGSVDELRRLLDRDGVPPLLDAAGTEGLLSLLAVVGAAASLPLADADVVVVTNTGWSSLPVLAAQTRREAPLVLAHDGASPAMLESPVPKAVSERFFNGLDRIIREVADVVSEPTVRIEGTEAVIDLTAADLEQMLDRLLLPARRS